MKKGGNWCSAPNCTSNSNTDKNVSFFRFPKDKDRSKRWVINCRRKDLLKRDVNYLYINCKICSKHFEESMFLNFLKNRLKENAAPTLFDISNSPLMVKSKRKKSTKNEPPKKQETMDTIDKVLLSDADCNHADLMTQALIETSRCTTESAYKHADGKKLDGRRVLVDVERARTVKGWLPRRLGGGLGGTRRGGPDVNIKHSGREDNERERERYRLEREREERGGRDRERERMPERRRSRSRERRRRSRSRSRDRKRRRSRERVREDIEETETRPRDKERERDRDRDKERKRRRSKSRERDRERKRDRKERRERDRGDKLEYIKTDDGGEIRIKEEPMDDYPEYPQYHTQSYAQAHVKYEDDQEEQKYEPDNSHHSSRHYDDEYEEGEAY